MQKKQIITIAGKPGSGKSSTARLLAERLEYDHFSSGDLFREIARRRGQNVKEANLHAEGKVLDEQHIDELVDSRLREIGQTEDKKVIDSRTAWHWIPGAFNVFLDLDLQVAADRIVKAMEASDVAGERNEHIPQSVPEYARELGERLASESRRYESLYSIDPYTLSNYDLVVNSGESSLETVVEQILQAYYAWQRNLES
jgi:predicted cytidylate kinase